MRGPARRGWRLAPAAAMSGAGTSLPGGVADAADALRVAAARAGAALCTGNGHFLSGTSLPGGAANAGE